MRRLIVTLTLLLSAIAPGLVLAQTDDTATERARIADQRIKYEAERRAREEEERLKQAQAESADRYNTAGETTEPSEQRGPAASEPVARGAENTTDVAPADRIEMSRALEQLRELGALRDAGYLTDEEFQLLKKKILDDAL